MVVFGRISVDIRHLLIIFSSGSRQQPGLLSAHSWCSKGDEPSTCPGLAAKGVQPCLLQCTGHQPVASYGRWSIGNGH